jgi:hypothetical protein
MGNNGPEWVLSLFAFILGNIKKTPQLLAVEGFAETGPKRVRLPPPPPFYTNKQPFLLLRWHQIGTNIKAG